MNNLLVTGANGDVGREIVRVASERDFRVLATSKSNGDAPEGASSWFPGFDLIKPNALDELSEIVSRETSGRLQVVHAVGYFPKFSYLGDLSFDEIERTLTTNLISTFNMAHSFIPIMVGRGGGCFIAFSSHAAGNAYPKMTPFSCAKKGVETLIEGLASEYSGDKVVPIAIAPATIDTAQERRRVPFGDFENWLTPKEVADKVVSLLIEVNPLLAGNVIHMFRYSPFYFVDGYLKRIGEK